MINKVYLGIAGVAIQQEKMGEQYEKEDRILFCIYRRYDVYLIMQSGCGCACRANARTNLRCN
jgi:hypothetical protein